MALRYCRRDGGLHILRAVVGVLGLVIALAGISIFLVRRSARARDDAEAMGAERIVLSSASSKTAYGAAFRRRFGWMCVVRSPTGDAFRARVDG